MEKDTKVRMFLGLIILSGLIVSFLFALRSRDRVISQKSNVLGVNVVENMTHAPEVVSSAPLTVEIYKNYIYYLKIFDSDTDTNKINVSLKEGPDWLYVDSFKKIVSGVPLVSGDYKVVLELNDGINTSEYSFYIVVQEYE